MIKNKSNFEAHYRGTGPEIWKQTRGNVDAFVSGAGKLSLYPVQDRTNASSNSQGQAGPFQGRRPI
jgi:hypothetical protein